MTVEPHLPSAEPSRRRPRRRGMAAATLWRAFVLALVCYCLLASASLVRAAQGQPDGALRSVTVPVAQGIDRVANFFSLNRPYDALASALGRSDAEAEPIVEFPPATLPPLVNDSVTTTTFPPPREVSTVSPLRVEVLGDSLSLGLGKAMQDRTGTDPLVKVNYDGRVSSGLARPDFYNWPARMIERLSRADADVVVLQFGANDDQNLLDERGRVVASEGTAAWDAEYRRRIAGVFDLLNNRRRRVVWVNEPVMRNGSLSALLSRTNRMAAEEAAARPWVMVVDSNRVVAGPNGEYVDYLTPADGTPAVRCRAGDGVHPLPPCAVRIADLVLGSVRPVFPVATTTTTTAPPATTSVPSTVTTPGSG